MIHPFATTPNTSTSNKPILYMARDSSSGFRQGHHTILDGHKKYNRGSGRNRTNEQYGLRSAPSARRVVMWHFFVQLFEHFVDYRGRIFFAKLLQKPQGMPTHLWLSSSLPSSADRCRLPLCVSLCQLPSLGSLTNCPSGFSRTSLPLHFRLVGDLESKPFVWLSAKTKWSSAWRTTHILSQPFPRVLQCNPDIRDPDIRETLI